MFADDEVGFAVTDDSDRAAAFDALRAARLAMSFADSVVVNVAHHVDDLAGHAFLGTGAKGFFSVLRGIVRESERRKC